MRCQSRLVCLLVIFGLVAARQRISERGQRGEKRQKRLFSIFNVVTWQNGPCRVASDATMLGSCMTESDCRSNGGSADGNCASGFGVCCMFTLSQCGGAVNQNCTYIRNSGFPTAVTATQSCTYSFNRICGGLCQIRLDFDNLVTAGPPTTGMNIVGLCSDSGDTVTAMSPTGVSPPVICGTNTGQHMYIETGNTGSAGSLAINFGSATASRSYKIKVTYILCSSPLRAPADCVQYYTGLSGTVMSYNYGSSTPQFLADQDYRTCFRQEQGYCELDLFTTPGTSPDRFDLYGVPNTPNDVMGLVDVCVQTHISIPRGALTLMTAPPKANRYCGGFFAATDLAMADGTVRNDVVPFEFSTFSLAQLGADNAAMDPIAGYSLDFRQVPCNN